MLKGQKGITLVALVITIIVLLILAGVTITLTLREDGIFKTAEKAGENYTHAQREELDELNSFQSTVDRVIENVTD